MMEQAVIRIHPRDNVAVALRPLSAGEAVSVDGQAVPIREEIPFGHKVALTDLAEGEMVVKYGAPIGHAAQAVPAGAWLHSQDVYKRQSMSCPSSMRTRPSRSWRAPAARSAP